MTDSSLSGRLANFLSSAFLALALLVAAGFAVHSMSMNEATAKAEANSQVCDTWNGVDACQGPPTNCFCEIVITPEDKLSEESSS